ncbi:hypothetical protein KUTeg_024393 [Tegillarca granosa]|uniref:Small-subunit processome Utp12 domain-containing protein n=1 Tax=Tegillarca granosa TaxID=220873 RepID=A0ABQ9DXY1_TEGGR|nr:hypothetical protein KUTeg_024393 [Tegillarca granosa]
MIVKITVNEHLPKTMCTERRDIDFWTICKKKFLIPGFHRKILWYLLYFRFSNLLGSVYRKGNVTFTPDGNCVVSPVGNRVTVNKSETLPMESTRNITCVAIAPDGYTMILVNEDGEAYLCSLISKTVLHTYHFHRPVHQIKFSPDGRKFAVTKEKTVQIFHTPGKNREFNPFVLYKTFSGAYDSTVCIDWTSDSQAFCVGSKDMNTRVYGTQRFTNLTVYSVGGHTDAIVGSFFEADSLDNGHVCVFECDTDLDELEPYKPKDVPIEDKTDDDMETEDTKNLKQVAKHSFKEARGEGAAYAKLTSTAYHKSTHILVTGFEDGAFFLHEMPDFNLIHSLSISDQVIASVAFNNTGDWIALACSGLGQLLVWEWQSETYVLKQQGHFNNMNCLCYSPDGQYIVTGGDDGKVKVWNTSSGFCFVTFNEHMGGITGVAYRNFRTFTSPRPVQFSCITVDHSGEVVCAGGRDTFEIFVWSMKTGRLLEVLSGHEGPISCVSFSMTKSLLASASWDKSVKLWDVFENKGAKETIQLTTDAISTLNAQISFWNPTTAVQKGSIEGRHDLGYSRKDSDKVTAKTLAAGKAFTTVCYSADGRCILAAGQSKNEYLDKKKMTEWGSLALVDQGEGESDGKNISLPGVKKGDMSSRHWKPEVRVTSIQFSPTGRAWAATSTEGLLIYSIDQNLVFDPFDLEIEITPSNVKKTLTREDYSTALMLSFRLNESKLIQEVVESIPISSVEVICENLPDTYVDKLLDFLARQIESTAHIEFYMTWINRLLMHHGPKLKQRSQKIMAILRSLQKGLTRKHEDIGKITDENLNKLNFLFVVKVSFCYSFV